MASERYQIRRIIGKGGGGNVYDAYDVKEQKTVAIKFMKVREDVPYEKTYERFMREIKIAQELNHPHILSILDAGKMVYEGIMLPYLTTDYIPDGSLQSFIEKKPPHIHWSLSQTADVILQAAEALMYMHTREYPLVHWDVKPDNFLIRLEHRPERIAYLYLSDFGIARQERPTAYLASTVVGTYEYLSPEQIEAKQKRETDQYALAVMACQLLTGKYPFQVRSRSEYIDKHLKSQPIPPSILNQDRITSTEVDAIILRALGKEYRQRFPTILEFAQELYLALMKQQQDVSDVSMLSTVSLSPEKLSAHAAPTVPVTPPPAPIPLHPIDVNENQDRDDAMPVRQPKVKAASAKATSKTLPLLSLRQLWSRELPTRPSMISWSPDSNALICTFFGSEVPRLIRSGGTMETVNRLASPGHIAAWSLDSRFLAVSFQSQDSMQRKILVWNLSNSTEWSLPLPLNSNSEINGLDWSSRGQLAVWVDDSILLYRLLPRMISAGSAPPPETRLSVKDMHCGNIGTLRWSPDGALLAAGTLNGAVLCWHVETLQLQWQEPPSGRRVYSLAGSPDSSSLAVGFQNRRVVIWNVHERRILRTWDKLSRIAHMLNISPLQDMVVVATKQGLLFGNVRDDSPSLRHPGQFLATWSPIRPELATLDAHDETTLVLWEKV